MVEESLLYGAGRRLSHADIGSVESGQFAPLFTRLFIVEMRKILFTSSETGLAINVRVSSQSHYGYCPAGSIGTIIDKSTASISHHVDIEAYT